MQLTKLGAASMAALGSWSVLTLLPAAPGSPAKSPPQLIPNGNARDNGCRTGGTGGINATEPSWVNVVARDHRKKVVEGRIVSSHVTHEDFPFNHDSHDMCFFIAPDPQYQGMQSDANGIQNGERVLEGEWETKHFPPQFWPSPGDRAWVIGRHVFDCGHPPYRTEIHPPVGTAFTRTEPMIFPNESEPVMASKTFVYFGNQGGYFVDKVGGVDYVFNVPYPPSPGRGATPRFRILQRPGGGMPDPILTPKVVNGRQMLEVKVPLSTVSDPTVRWNLYEWIPRARRQMASYPARDPRRLVWPKIDRPTNVFRYGAVVAAAWDQGSDARVPLGRPGVRFLRVNLQDIKVHDKREGALSGKGEWNMQIRVNGEWIQLPERSVNNGDTIPIKQIVDVFVPDNGSVQIQVNGWEDDNDGHFRVGPPPSLSSIGATNENEKLPPLHLEYKAAANFGVGAKSVRANPGHYTINFSIEELKRWEPKAGIVPPIIRDRPPIRTTTGGGG